MKPYYYIPILTAKKVLVTRVVRVYLQLYVITASYCKILPRQSTQDDDSDDISHCAKPLRTCHCKCLTRVQFDCIKCLLCPLPRTITAYRQIVESMWCAAVQG